MHGRVCTRHGWSYSNVGKGTNFLGTEQERSRYGLSTDLGRFNIKISDKWVKNGVGAFLII